MQRYDIINQLIESHNLIKYLEIGVRDPDDCFNRINAPSKHSVDPCIEVEAEVDYKYTSDSFFNLLESNSLNLPANYKWDIIFIDGLHISDQTERDILNALNHLSQFGYIVMHDCNPPLLSNAREEFHDISTPAGGNWNGTVWKAFYKFRASRPDLSMFTVDTDWGVGLITRGSQICCEFDNPYYDYKKFEENRNTYLNLISVDTFKNAFKKYHTI